MKNKLRIIVYILGLTVSTIYLLKALIGILFFGFLSMPVLFLLVIIFGNIGFFIFCLISIYHPKISGIYLIISGVLSSVLSLLIIKPENTYECSFSNVVNITTRYLFPIGIIGILTLLLKKNKKKVCN